MLYETLQLQQSELHLVFSATRTLQRNSLLLLTRLSQPEDGVCQISLVIVPKLCTSWWWFLLDYCKLTFWKSAHVIQSPSAWTESSYVKVQHGKFFIQTENTQIDFSFEQQRVKIIIMNNLRLMQSKKLMTDIMTVKIPGYTCIQNGPVKKRFYQ